MRAATLLLAGGGPFLLYLASLYPGLSSYRDAGDMASSAWTLGVAHPPGYPLYVLLGRLWCALLPVGSVAYRLNVLSALAGAAACALGAAAAARLAGERGRPWFPAAAGAALVLAAAPAFWHLSLLSEMYSLNAFYAAALLWLAASDSPRARPLFAAGLLLGLGLGNHQTLLAVAPALAWSARGRLSGRGWAWVFGLFALGAAVFLFLPVRAWTDPWLDWGDPRTPARLWRVLTRGDYGGVRLHPDRPAGLGDPALWRSGLLYAGSVFRAELSAAGAALAVWGVWCGRRSRAVQGLTAAFLLAGPVFIVWANLDPARPESRPILEPHLVLPLVCAAVLAGTGAADLLGRLSRRPAAVLGAVLAAAALWSRRADAAALAGHRTDFSAWDYGTALAAGLPRGSLVLDPDDPTAFTLSYLRSAHGKADGLTPLLYFRTRWGYERLKRRSPELLPQREIRSGVELLDALVSHNLDAGRPLFVDLPQKAPPGTQTLAEGLGYRLRRDAPDAAARRAAFERARTAFRVLLVRPARPDAGFFSRHAAAYWSSGLNNAAIEAERLGLAPESERLYASALAFDPDLAQAWNNWANSALQRGDGAAAEGRYRASLAIKDDAAVRYNLGRAYLLAGRLDEAERTYKESIAAGGPLEAANDLGLVYLRAGRLEDAARQWVTLLRARPDFPLAYYNLGVTFEKMGRRREAAQAARAWAELSPSPADRAEAAAWLRRLEN